MTAAKKKAVARKPKGGNVVVLDMDADAGLGMENVSQDEIAIPILSILQKMSPQCDADDGAYMEDAKPGMFYNTATGDLYDGEEGVWVVPVMRKRSFIEWVPRDQGGGFVGEHSVEEGLQNQMDAEYLLPNGNQLDDTRTFFIMLIHEDGSWEPAMLSMTASGIKRAKRWVSIIDAQRLPSGAKAPIFGRFYRINTVTESNDKGTWKNWAVGRPVPLTIPGDIGIPELDVSTLYSHCKEFHEQLGAGEVKVSHDQGQNATVDTEASDF